MNRLRVFIALLWVETIVSAITFPVPAVAGQADTVRVMDYNILDYPGTNYTTRDPYFRKIINVARPDVIVVGEMTSQAGVDYFLNDVLNYPQPGPWSTIPFTNGPDTDPHIFYKAAKVTFLSARFFPMADGLRNVGVYAVRINATSDTLYLYTAHLKASTGYETQRGTEARAIRDSLNKLPAGTKFLFIS